MKPFLRAYGFPCLTAILLAISFPTWSLFPLAWVALAPLLIHTDTRNAKQTALAFFVAGTLTYVFLLRWILVQVFWAGGWAVIGLVGLSVFYGAQWAIVGGAWKRLTRNAHPLVSAIVVALLFAVMETAQNATFNVFGAPGSLAYSQGPNAWIIQWAALGGVPLVSFFIVLVNALIASPFLQPKDRWIGPVAAALLVAAAHAIGFGMINRTEYGDPAFQVGIFQSDFPIEMKHDSDYSLEMVSSAARKSAVLGDQAPLDLMVWPEALVMSQIGSRDTRKIVTEFASGSNCMLFTGSARTGGDPPMAYNSAYMVYPDGTISDAYDKIQLAPFGEYIPLIQFLSFIPTIVPAIGQMGAGEQPVVFPSGARKLGPLICFEVLFPSMSEELRKRGVDFLVVITNLGWFGNSNAIPHEFEIARFRAIETRLPLVHAANTGISGVYDPYGRFQAMHSLVDRFGNYVPLREDISPRRTIQNRLASAFPLPSPAPRAVPWPPHLFGWVAFPVALLVALANSRFRSKAAAPVK